MAESTGEIVNGCSPDYEDSCAAWNALYRSRPREIIYPKDVYQVQAAVRYARKQGRPLRIRSGGHSFDGYSSVDGGVVISLSKMNTIEIRDDDTVVLGPSARFGSVYPALGLRGLAIPGGTCGGVAVGGNCLGGGAGLLARSHGWLTQSIRSLEVVDAEGEILTVDSEHHPDLFWGLRGAGGNNFGVVTSLTFQAYRLPTLTQGLIRWDWEHFVEVADAFQRWLPTLDSRVNTVAHLERKELGFVAINVISLLPHAETETAVAPLLDALPPIIDQKYVATAYADAVHEAIDPEMLYSKAIRATTLMGSALGPLSRGVLEKLKNRLAVGRGETALYLYGLGGADGVAAQRHRADPVSLPHVNALLAPYTRIYWTDPAEDEYNLAWMAGLGKDILPSLDATYINSHDIHVDDRVYPRYGESFARLVDIKRQYDPSNLFSFQASIPPSLSREEAITLGLPESQIKEAQERGLLSS